MELKNINHVFFIGIGGIGMSALARYFQSLGKKVSGYDKTCTELCLQLQAEGMDVFFDDELNLYPKEVDLVVYTPAIPKSHKGLLFYQEHNYVIKKRSEVLGIISQNKFSICVAGSHGKTTVSSMIAHILLSAGKNVTAFLGGISTNYNSNYLHQKIDDSSELVVIEADEFDRSFHRLQPAMEVITAVDTDHLDIYGTKEKIDEAFVEFVQKMKEDGLLVLKSKQSIDENAKAGEIMRYALSDSTADVFCPSYQIHHGGYQFHIQFGKETITGCELNIGGFHNIENAIAAFCIAKKLNIPNQTIIQSLASFKGIKRRFEVIFQSDNTIYIDDYAHHPEEINVFLKSCKELYPTKKITAIFQPHLFSRTNDLAIEFGNALSTADQVLLLDIYPARELPIAGVSSKLILDHVTTSYKRIVSKEELLQFVKSEKMELLSTIGAGDIDKLIQPIKELLIAQ